VRVGAFGQIAALRTDVMGEVAQIRTTADRRLGDTLARVDVALGEVHEIRGDFQPILAHVNNITEHADDATKILFARNALPAQLLGLTAATKVTMGEWTQLSRDAQRALPGFLDQGKSITGNVQLAKGGEADVVAVFPDLSSAAAAQYQIVGPPRDAVIRSSG